MRGITILWTLCILWYINGIMNVAADCTPTSCGHGSCIDQHCVCTDGYLPPYCITRDYNNTYELAAEQAYVSWSINYNDQSSSAAATAAAATIDYQYRSKGTFGWTAFGWAVVGQTTRRMCNSDAIIVWNGQDQPSAYRVSCDGRGSNSTSIRVNTLAAKKPDSYLQNASVAHVDGWTIVTFRRALHTGSADDIEITPAIDMRVVYAFGTQSLISWHDLDFGDPIIRFDPKACPNDCSGHGRCVNGQCVCDVGYMPSDCSKKYDRSVPLKTSASISWSIIGNDISFQMTATTSGWISFGLDVGKEMCNSEDVIGWIPTGTSPIISAYIVPCEHRNNDEQEAADIIAREKHTGYLQERSIAQIDGQLVIRWRRALITGIAGDVDISLTQATPIVWAWGRANKLDFHDGDFGAQKINFGAGQCNPPDCNGRGICTPANTCQCQTGWQEPDCSVYLPKLVLTPDLTFEWSIDNTITPGVLNGRLTYVRNGTCWTGIGFRRDARVDMNNTDYLIGQIWPNGYASVIDAHVNATRPHMMPLGDGDDVTSVIRSGGEWNGVANIYNFTRLLVPKAENPHGIAIVKGSPLYLIFAYCNPDLLPVGTGTWHGRSGHSKQIIAVDLFPPVCIPANCGGRGECISGKCRCDAGWSGSGCDTFTPFVQLDDNLSFSWRVDNQQGILYGNITVVHADGACWGGIGLRADNIASMNNSDFINGQVFSDGIINVTEWHANPAKAGGRGFPIINDGIPTIISSGGEISGTRVVYHFTRRLIGDASNPYPLPLIKDRPVYLVWAHCNKASGTLAYHSKYRSDYSLKIDLFYQNTSCSSTCNGHGVCNRQRGVCDCDAGYQGDTCSSFKPEVQLTDNFKFAWSTDAAAGHVTGVLTLSKQTSACWAGIGLKTVNVLDMMNCDFIVGQSFTDGRYNVSDYHVVNKAHSLPIRDDGVSSITSSSGSRAGDTITYTFTRSLVPDASNPSAVSITKGEKLYLLWAHCRGDAPTGTMAWHTRAGRALSMIPINFFATGKGCPMDCSGHGQCIDDVCQCQGGWRGDACEKPAPILVFIKDVFFMTWTIDEDAGVLNGVITLKNKGACWASVGLRNDRVLSMANTDFIVAQVSSSGISSVTDYHPATRAHDSPLINTNSSILSSSGVYEGNTMIWNFTRRLVPKVRTASEVTLQKDVPVWVQWAHCRPDQPAAGILGYHGDSRSSDSDLQSVDFFSGDIIDDDTEASSWSVLAVGVAFIIGVLLGLSSFSCCGGKGPLEMPKRNGTPSTSAQRRLPLEYGIFLVFLFVCLLLSLTVFKAEPGVKLNLASLDAPTAMFYLFILSLSFCMMFNLAHPTSSLAFFKRDYRCCSVPRWLCSESTVSAGEGIVLSMYISLYAWFFAHYWNSPKMASIDPVERAARVMGHCNEFNLGLLILPVTRNSIWCLLFGVPFERAIRYHRWLGRLAFTTMTLHLALMWRVWVMDGVWTQVAIQFQVVGGQTKRTRAAWTGEVAWLISLVMFITAQEFFRRRFFESFFFTHQLAMVFFVFAAIHSHDVEGSLMQYLIVGLSLYVFDRLFRFYRGHWYAYKVVSVRNEISEVTKLTLRNEHAGVNANDVGLSHVAGQYCFINIPSISRLEWHPFSISSPPGADVFTFHIKSMGVNTWTGKLAEIASNMGTESSRAVSDAEDQSTSLRVLVDGPYGSPGVILEDCEYVTLIAGGVGVTPIASMLGDLYNTISRGVRDKQSFNVRHVTFIWVVKEPFCLPWFGELIANCRRFPEYFDIQLYSTLSRHEKEGLAERASTDTFSSVKRRALKSNSGKGNDKKDSMTQGLLQPSEYTNDEEEKVLVRPHDAPPLPSFITGRPKLPELFEQITRRVIDRGGSNVGAFVCGPPQLIDSVETLCSRPCSDSRVRFDLHKETYSL